MDESGPSIFFSIRGFFTPAVLFVVLNIVIATIALTSRTVRAHHNHQEPAADHPNHHRPGQTTLERVRSIGLFRFGSHDLPHQPEPDQIHYHHPPSALERVRSGLFGFGSRDIAQHEPDHTHQTHYHQQQHQPSALERVRSGLFGYGSRDIAQPEPDHTHQTHYHQHQQPSALERVRSGLFGFGSRDIAQPEPDHTQQTHYHQHHQPSALERVRSGIFGFGPPDIPQPDTQHFRTQTAVPDPDLDPEPEHYDMDHHFRRIQSESVRPKPVMAEQRGTLMKLASALSWRAPEAVVRRRPVVAAAEEEEVDARADDFINRFKHQLKLQRLDSIMRYKEMLTRGR